MGERADVVVEGRRLALSNLDKVLYPQADFTKAHVIDYYRRIAPVLLPHLRGRPVTLKRYPDGVEGEFFYERQCPPHRPEWLDTAPIPSASRGRDIDYCVLNDLPSLVWAANLADLELHTFLHRGDDPQAPTMLVFDLDPGHPATLLECCRVGLRLRALFSDFGLDVYPKTSGSKGLQVHVPLNTPTTYEQTKPFARAVAEALERDDADLVTSNMSKARRTGRVLVDWSQNDDHKSTVCVYSLRAKARPTVSTPLTWSEVERAVRHEDVAGLTLEPEALLQKVERHGDLFAPVLEQEQGLPLVE